MPATIEDESLLTTTQVARRLSVCSKTVRNMVSTGRIPAIRLGPRSLRFRQDDIERLTAARIYNSHDAER